MEIEFLQLKGKASKYKASVHATGKLNFSPECNQIKGFENIRYVKVGTEANNKKNIYLVVAEEGEENILKLNKSGKSMYINFSDVLDELNIDFKKNIVTFDFFKNEDQYNGKDFFTLKKNESKKRESKKDKSE